MSHINSMDENGIKSLVDVLDLVILTSLVYEKQQKLRIMMKMHGLGADPYWMITYAYFLVIYLAYMLCFVLFGCYRLKFFTLNDYSIQFVFYFIYVNLQISLAFLVASIFANVKTVAVVGYIMVFGSGLLGGFLFQCFVEDTSFQSIQISLTGTKSRYAIAMVHLLLGTLKVSLRMEQNYSSGDSLFGKHLWMSSSIGLFNTRQSQHDELEAKFFEERASFEAK